MPAVVLDPEQRLIAATIDLVIHPNVVKIVPVLVGAVVVLREIAGEFEVRVAGSINAVEVHHHGRRASLTVNVLGGEKILALVIGKLHCRVDVAPVGPGEITVTPLVNSGTLVVYAPGEVSKSSKSRTCPWAAPANIRLTAATADAIFFIDSSSRKCFCKVLASTGSSAGAQSPVSAKWI